MYHSPFVKLPPFTELIVFLQKQERDESWVKAIVNFIVIYSYYIYILMLEQEVLTNMTLIIRCSSYDSFLMFTMITFCSIYACSINTQKKNCFWIQREQKLLSSIWNCYLSYLLSPYVSHWSSILFLNESNGSKNPYFWFRYRSFTCPRY